MQRRSRRSQSPKGNCVTCYQRGFASRWSQCTHFLNVRTCEQPACPCVPWKCPAMVSVTWWGLDNILWCLAWTDILEWDNLTHGGHPSVTWPSMKMELCQKLSLGTLSRCIASSSAAKASLWIVLRTVFQAFLSSVRVEEPMRNTDLYV